MRNIVDRTLRRPRKNLFAYPADGEIPLFETVIDEVARLTSEERDGKQVLTVRYVHNDTQFELTAVSHTLQSGHPDKPKVIYTPWYGGTSRQVKRFLADKTHANWTYEGIDLFVPARNFNQVLATASGSQYSYALGMRLLAERINQAHAHHQKVALVGISYGANLISAYLSRNVKLPDAIVGIEGGDILRSTTESYISEKSDPKTIARLEKDGLCLPAQSPFSKDLAVRAAAVINPTDELVKGQQDMWGEASKLLYVKGSHFMALLSNRAKIRQFTNEFLDSILQ